MRPGWTEPGSIWTLAMSSVVTLKIWFQSESDLNLTVFMGQSAEVWQRQRLHFACNKNICYWLFSVFERADRGLMLWWRRAVRGSSFRVQRLIIQPNGIFSGWTSVAVVVERWVNTYKTVFCHQYTSEGKEGFSTYHSPTQTFKVCFTLLNCLAGFTIADVWRPIPRACMKRRSSVFSVGSPAGISTRNVSQLIAATGLTVKMCLASLPVPLVALVSLWWEMHCVSSACDLARSQLTPRSW